MTLAIGCLLVSIGLFLSLAFLYLVMCAIESWAEYDDVPCAIAFSTIGIIVLAIGLWIGLSGWGMIS